MPALVAIDDLLAGIRSPSAWWFDGESPLAQPAIYLLASAIVVCPRCGAESRLFHIARAEAGRLAVRCFSCSQQDVVEDAT